MLVSKIFIVNINVHIYFNCIYILKIVVIVCRSIHFCLWRHVVCKVYAVCSLHTTCTVTACTCIVHKSCTVHTVGLPYLQITDSCPRYMILYKIKIIPIFSEEKIRKIQYGTDCYYFFGKLRTLILKHEQSCLGNVKT